MTKKHDWELIEKDVLNGILSFPEIAKKYGIDRSYLHKQVKKRNWTRKKTTKTTSVDLIENRFISVLAKDQYYLITGKMGDQLTIFDDNILIPLVNMYSRMIKLEEIVMIEGEVITSPKTGGKYINPSFNALSSATKTVAALSKELGLTLTSRKKVGVVPKGNKKEKDFWDILEDTTVNVNL